MSESDVLTRLQSALAGQYSVERELGRGGMATVFLGRDLRLDRAVAIKVLHADLAQALGADRFRREIEIATRLSHPNILPLYDSGDAAGLLYYVMPFVTGESLRDRLKRERQLGVEDAVQISREVAAALDYAHRQGVIHRDIKPENILLEDGHAVVADFGIARAISASQDQKLTQTGITLGTPMYMSPEQACAERDLDGRSDQYSLAAVTYEMLAGQPPFVGPTAQAIIARQMLDQVPSLTVVRRTIPPEVEDAVLRALSKVKADRFPTVGQFADALANPSSGTHSWRAQTGSITRQRVAWSPAKRRLVFAAWGLAFVGGGAGLSYAGWRLLLHPKGSAGASPAYAAGLDPRHVAVLYLADGSKNKSLGYIADGLTEELIDRLGQTRGLDVLSRNAASAARRVDVDEDRARDSLATALKVGSLVTGEVEEAGRGYKVTVRLVDALSGADFAHKSFDAPKENVLAMRDTLAAVVADFLRERLGAEVALRDLRGGTSNTQAWSLAQRAERLKKDGEERLADRDLAGARGRLASADSLLATAESLDPNWVAPTLARADIASRLAKAAAEPGEIASIAATGLAHVGRVLARDPRNVDALELRGTLNYTRYVRRVEPDRAKAKMLLDSAKTDLKSVVTIAPSHANAWQVLSHLYLQIPDVTEAKIAARRAYEEDAYLANAPDVIWRLVQTSYELEQFSDASQWCDEGARRFPRNPRFVECKLLLLTSPFAKPDVRTAWRLADSLQAVVGSAPGNYGGRRFKIMAAMVIARAGLADSARHVLARNRANEQEDPEHELQQLEVYARVLLDDRDEAFALLKSMLASNPEHFVSIDKVNSWWWRPLKSDPRFREITRPVD